MERPLIPNPSAGAVFRQELRPGGLARRSASFHLNLRSNWCVIRRFRGGRGRVGRSRTRTAERKRGSRVPARHIIYVTWDTDSRYSIPQNPATDTKRCAILAPLGGVCPMSRRLGYKLLIPERFPGPASNKTRPPLLSSATRLECSRLGGTSAHPPYGMPGFSYRLGIHTSTWASCSSKSSKNSS